MVDLSFFNISAQKEEIPLSQTHPNQTQNKVMVEDNPSTLYGYINSLRAEWAKETTKLIENLIKKNNKERDEERAEWAKERAEERAEEKAQRKKLTKKNKEQSELINKLIKLLTENENISS